MGMKTVDFITSKNSYIPGPGQYDQDSKDSRVKSEPKFSIGTSKRADIANSKERNQIPGPGNYDNSQTNSTKRQAPKFGFGTSKREKLLA